jgi:hypothetical protein
MAESYQAGSGGNKGMGSAVVSLARGDVAAGWPVAGWYYPQKARLVLFIYFVAARQWEAIR